VCLLCYFSFDLFQFTNKKLYHQISVFFSLKGNGKTAFHRFNFGFDGIKAGNGS